MAVRPPVEVRPTEPGWWLASDGRWYPPETRPGSTRAQVIARLGDPVEETPGFERSPRCISYIKLEGTSDGPFYEFCFTNDLLTSTSG